MIFVVPNLFYTIIHGEITTYWDFHCLLHFFFNMLSEGSNRITQARLLRIDEKDHFGILLAIAQNDTIGAITVKPVNV